MGVGTVALWAVVRATDRLWAIAWAMMSGCMLLAFWSAVYWRSAADVCCRDSTNQSQSRLLLPLRSPRLSDSLSAADQSLFVELANASQTAVTASHWTALSLNPALSKYYFDILPGSIATDSRSWRAHPSHPGPSGIPLQPLCLSQRGITTDLGLNFHNQSRATPSDFI